MYSGDKLCESDGGGQLWQCGCNVFAFIRLDICEGNYNRHMRRYRYYRSNGLVQFHRYNQPHATAFNLLSGQLYETD
jgi:hypothetical protein